jgi:nucleotide-binding universal stress UspA family protein
MRRRHTVRFFKKILFPVDLSRASHHIAPCVREVATKFNAELHLLFVVRVFEHFSSIHLSRDTIKSIEAEVGARGETNLQKFMQTFFESGSCTMKVVFGDPAEEIMKYVECEGIDLIIIGTHGKKGLEKVLFGSVANRVIKMSPVPVLSVNPHGCPVE